MSHHWFRYYDDTVNDPKILRLSDNLFRIWIGLLCLASKNFGKLPCLDDICVVLRLQPAKAREAIETLTKSELLDKTDDGIEPHNWNGRQYKSDVSNERVKRYRERKRNVTVTPPENRVQIQSTDTEKKETREVALSPEVTLWFETFWFAWPHKVGKPAALKAFRSAVKRAPFDRILVGVENYIRDKPPDRPWLNPATFLNQNRWEDQPAQVQNGKTSNVLQATDNLVSILDRFNTEADAVCGPEGAADVRLISQG